MTSNNQYFLTREELRAQSKLILERIKHIPLYGVRTGQARGSPNNVEIADLVEHTLKNQENKRRTIDIWRQSKEEPEMSEVMHRLYGISSLKRLGTRYWVSTANPSTEMVSGPSQLSTTFAYTNYVDGDESLLYDGSVIASTPDNLYPQGKKIPSTSYLRNVVKEINPDSKLL